MRPEILEYLKTQRVGVIALQMPDGSPHAATVHFAHSEEPLQFIFLTDKNYRKSEALMATDSVRASLVIGTTEGKDEKTFQLDGTAALTTESFFKDIYLSKFPHKKKYDSPDDIFFTFSPTWWRFTDWGAPEGKTIYTSDGGIVVKGKN